LNKTPYSHYFWRNYLLNIIELLQKGNHLEVTGHGTGTGYATPSGRKCYTSRYITNQYGDYTKFMQTVLHCTVLLTGTSESNNFFFPAVDNAQQCVFISDTINPVVWFVVLPAGERCIVQTHIQQLQVKIINSNFIHLSQRIIIHTVQNTTGTVQFIHYIHNQ
jgi:hypothetical protein